MELRELEYFLAITRHGSLSEAARSLHLTQPALTRSLRHLEEELGKQLIIRGSRKIELTENGALLVRRAEELLQMADKTVHDIQSPDNVIEGDIYVCSGETKALHFLTQATERLMRKYPNIRLHVSSGDSEDVILRLENGMIDFGLLFPPFDNSKYASIRISFADTWGLFMLKDSPLAARPYITATDIHDIPLIVPRAHYQSGMLSHILPMPEGKLNIAATYSLIFNGALMVTDGIGCLLGLNHILNLSGTTVQCFRPLYPAVTSNIHICWKRHVPMSRQAAALLAEMRAMEHEEIRYLFNQEE